MSRTIAQTSLALLTLFLCPEALAQEAEPRLSADLLMEWQNEYAYSSDDRNNEKNNSFLRTELAPTLRLSEQIFIDGVFVFEQFDQALERNPGHGDHIFFEREGAFAEELKLNFASGPYAVWAGKFNPAFGLAWDFGRGIWSEDFAEDYEITEKLGLGAAYTWETEMAGNYTLSATTFFNDTTFLSGSIITARDQTDKRDGGAGNTEDFSSYTAALDAENIAGIENLTARAGFRHLGQGDADIGEAGDDETGFVIGAGYILPLNESTELDLMAEYASVSNFGGVPDAGTGNFHDQDYTYLSAILRHGAWNTAIGYTQRDIDQGAGFNDLDDDLLQISAGYTFDFGLSAEIGYRQTEESGIDTNTAGFLFRYQRSF